MNSSFEPKWSKELVRFLSVKSQFIFWGNIYDIYPIELKDDDESITITLKLVDYLKTILSSNAYNLILSYEPILGFQCISGDKDKFKEITLESIPKDKPLECSLGKAASMIEKLQNTNIVYTATILNFSSRIPEIARNESEEFYYRMFRLMNHSTPKIIENNSARHHLILWLLDKENDIPAWYTLDNHRIKNLAIPKPDYELRKVIIQNLVKNIDGFPETQEQKKEEIVSIFINGTNSLYASEIISIVSLARREKILFSQINEAIRMYKLGIIENPWAKLDNSKMSKAEEILNQRVKGQSIATKKAGDIIKRAIYNLSGSQYSKHSQRPKGILFLAGPTGVGKTELAKSITEFVFGSETSYIRFDMSEFSHEHSDQRLIGAPPGYIGYDVGGELTNRVRQNPFSVILFDEIEKAHPKILDIFLQILDDGRLTSGRGETIYFSECLILFTSNLGIYEVREDGQKVQRVSPEMKMEDIKNSVLSAIEDFFKFKIGRPEILNRIGENIVVFDFIRKDIAVEIFNKMINNVLEKLLDNYKMQIELSPQAQQELLEVCCKDLNMGGRGIGNKIEDCFINPLSRILLEEQIPIGSKRIVKELIQENNHWTLKLTNLSN